MNKKILIPIIILVFVVAVFGSMAWFGKSKSNKTITEETDIKNENIVNATTNKDEEIVNETKDVFMSNILTFGKDDGIIRLYNKRGEMLDIVDLKELDIGHIIEIEENKNAKNEDKESESDDEDEYAYIKTSEGMIATKVEDGKILLYDKDGKVTESVSLSSYNQAKSNEEDKTEKTIDEVDSPIDTTFTVFRTIDNELIFRDNKRNALIKVEIEEDTIKTTLLLKNINLKELKNIYVTGESLYLTFNDKTSITQVVRHTATNGNIVTGEYEIGDVPDFIYPVGSQIYYSTPTKIGKYDTTLDEGTITEVDVGDKTLDMYIDGEFIYAINEFGKGKNNSVLMKIKMEDLTVDGIMELKGINSRFIGINENLAYIRQKDSIKEVDLINFKPKTSREREEGVPVQVKGNLLYTMKDGKLIVTNLSNNKEIESHEAEGFSIHIGD